MQCTHIYTQGVHIAIHISMNWTLTQLTVCRTPPMSSVVCWVPCSPVLAESSPSVRCAVLKWFSATCICSDSWSATPRWAAGLEVFDCSTTCGQLDIIGSSLSSVVDHFGLPFCDLTLQKVLDCCTLFVQISSEKPVSGRVLLADSGESALVTWHTCCGHMAVTSWGPRPMIQFSVPEYVRQGWLV